MGTSGLLAAHQAADSAEVAFPGSNSLIFKWGAAGALCYS